MKHLIIQADIKFQVTFGGFLLKKLSTLEFIVFSLKGEITPVDSTDETTFNRFPDTLHSWSRFLYFYRGHYYWKAEVFNAFPEEDMRLVKQGLQVTELLNI